jgi:membrane associated rhomboid family serine protease
MLADRQYMREPSYRPAMSLTLKLVLINVIVFIVECVAYPGGGKLLPTFAPDDLFALNISGLKHGYVWQFFTYQFMHGGFFHLLFNNLTLFAFGRVMEDTLGKSRYLVLYLASGVFGGLLQAFSAWVWPQYFGGSVVGASASILGIVAAFAMLYPEHQLRVYIFFVIPVTVRAKYILFISIIWAALGISFPQTPLGGHVAHAAHMGGILAGMFFVRYAMEWKFKWPQRKTPQRRPSPEFVSASKSKGTSWREAVPPAEQVSPDEFISREVDPILDKISAHGIQSLTDHERKVLDAARKKMAKP